MLSCAVLHWILLDWEKDPTKNQWENLDDWYQYLLIISLLIKEYLTLSNNNFGLFLFPITYTWNEQFNAEQND